MSSKPTNICQTLALNGSGTPLEDLQNACYRKSIKILLSAKSQFNSQPKDPGILSLHLVSVGRYHIAKSANLETLTSNNCCCARIIFQRDWRAPLKVGLG